MKKEYITLPNIVTSIRLLGGIILIFVAPLTTVYFVIYTIAGITDVIDGYLARKYHQVSEFGSKLDSVADLIFYAAMMVKILPFLIDQLPSSIWNYVGAILILRLLMYIINAVRKKSFLSSHSYLNKASGAMLFVLPYLVGKKYLESFSWMLIGVTGLAAIWELTYSIIKA